MVVGLDYLSTVFSASGAVLENQFVFGVLVPSCWPMGKSAAGMRKEVEERKNKKGRVRVC